jgi:hypothetical protein
VVVGVVVLAVVDPLDVVRISTSASAVAAVATAVALAVDFSD